MKKILVLQGLPASGKSTYAKQLLSVLPAGSAVRINNDDLSLMMFGSAYAEGEYVAQLLGKARVKLIEQAFAHHAELVIVDNTNLSHKTVRGLQQLADKLGVGFEIDNSFLKVPLEVCLARNAEREVPVPESVIIKMSQQVSGSLVF